MSNFWVNPQQWWEVGMERQRETDALLHLGETCIFIVKWSIRDFESGYVTKCPTCLVDPTIQGIYNQPAYDRCPTCYGTMYSGPHGGIKAKLFRPAIWQYGEEQTQWQKRGETENQSASVTSTGDFRCQPKDYIFRADGNRYEIQQVEAVHLTTGFGAASHSNTMISVNYPRVVLENPSSPAYTIPPLSEELIRELNPAYSNQVPDFSVYEWQDGPVVF
jgi:hypothetical protein